MLVRVSCPEKATNHKQVSIAEKNRKKNISSLQLYFGVTIEELVEFDPDFEILPVTRYRLEKNKKSAYSELYKSFLNSTDHRIRNNEKYLTFFEWFLLLQNNGHITYSEKKNKYKKSEYVAVHKIHTDLKWSYDNAQVVNAQVKNEENIKKEEKKLEIAKNKLFLIERNNEIIKLFLSGVNIMQIPKIIEKKYKNTITKQRVHQILVKYGIDAKAGGQYLNTTKKLVEKEKKSKRIAQKRNIQNIEEHFGNTVGELQDFDSLFKVCSLKTYIKMQYTETPYYILYKQYLDTEKMARYRGDTYLHFLDWYNFLLKNNYIIKDEKLNVYQRKNNPRSRIMKIERNLPWSINNIKIQNII